MRYAFCFALAALLSARTAQAIPYETFIDVDDEGDLQDLLAAGDIEQDTYDELLDLMSRGVDLAKADRNELYTLPNLTYEDVDAIIAFRALNQGRINDPSDLVGAGALSQDKLLSIAAFIIVRDPADNNPLAAKGWIRAWTRASAHDFAPSDPNDPFIPPTALRARVQAMRYLTAGVAVTNTRLEIGEPVYDPNRGALIADARSNQVHVPKAYVKWETNDFAAIAGTFRVGFGQRLVFDNSLRYTPNGLSLDDQIYYSADLATACRESAGELIVSPCVGAAGAEYVTPDFAWRDGLLGVAAGAKHIDLSAGWLQLYGWASAHRRSIYQYELYERTDACTDPHNDDNAACSAPLVYVTPEGNLLDPAARHSFASLPNVFQERVAGANLSYFADRRSSMGLTFYAADEVNLVDGMDLDFQEWSRTPYGGRFGALGANFSYGKNWFDLFGEAALSFDSMKVEDPNLTAAHGGGGPAGILRMTATRKKEELELVGRYYSTDYVNPFARPISASDEFEGQRARDEAGVRARYLRVSKEFNLRALVDVWTNPSTYDAVKLDTYVRANVKTTDYLWLGLWERYQDKGLGSAGGEMICYEVSSETDENGEPIACAGRQISTTARAQYVPNRQSSVTLQLQHQFLDDASRPDLMNKFRQDIAAWLIAYYRPTPGIRLRGRVRYLDEAINDNTYLERSISALGEVTARVRDKDSLRVRVDTKFWLDERMSTQQRVPNPELSLWLFYEARL